MSQPVLPPPTAEQIQQNQDALAAIREEVASTQQLVGAAQPSESLLASYSDNPGFLAHMPALISAYSAVRTVRGDGICFYRAVLVSLGLHLHSAGSLPPGLLARMQGTKATLVKHGYSDLLDEYVDALCAHLEGLVAPGATAEAAAVAPLQGGGADSILYGLRLLTAAHLHENAALFEDFIMGAYMKSIADFCAQDVLPSVEEADQIQIIALNAFLRTQCTIISLDAHAMHTNKIPEEEGTGEEAVWARLHLLLRPGHYDVLLPRV